MTRVAILPSAVADQIAAGEVVERPASVIKELVENALDAEARSIDVTVEDGGRRSIRVSDDGAGMDREDAQLALSRHATSKIRVASDLVGVATFGFRGEALPAIASVSEMRVETSSDGNVGTLIRASGGAISEVTDIARQRGTTVTVERIFFNSPARQKFLRGARSEWRAIMETLVSIALTRRDLRLTVTHDGRTVLAVPPAASLRARLAAIWGNSFAERLVDIEDVRGTTHVSGLAERPSDVGTGSRRTYVAVNGRSISDYGMLRGAELAYRSTVTAGARPSLFLELTLPADSIDINVHPAKTEIRFRDRWPVERAVEGAVRRALGTMDTGATFASRNWSARLPFDAPAAHMDVEALRTRLADGGALFNSGSGNPNVVTSPALRGTVAADEEPPLAIPHLVQLRHTYLMFEADDGVVLIDQHSAHERVLYEAFMRTLEQGEAPAQRLLFPLTLHLGPAEGEAFEAHQELFARLGFDVEPFGGHTLIVNSVPMPHPRFDAERCLRETLGALTGDRVGSTAAKHEKLAATVACKAAIKAGDVLSLAEMRALFASLARATLPAHDVHGRSTIVQLGWDEVERRFGRR